MVSRKDLNITLSVERLEYASFYDIYLVCVLVLSLRVWWHVGVGSPSTMWYTYIGWQARPSPQHRMHFKTGSPHVGQSSLGLLPRLCAFLLWNSQPVLCMWLMIIHIHEALGLCRGTCGWQLGAPVAFRFIC